MLRTFFFAALAAALVDGGTQTGAVRQRRSVLSGREKPVISVRVYNYAKFPNNVLARAEAEAARILGHAGVELNWSNCRLSPEPQRFLSCEPVIGPWVGARLISESMADKCQLKRAAFGVAEPAGPEGGGFAGMVNLVPSRVAEVYSRLDAAVALGVTIAHELGHLFGQSHSAAGIMRARWGPRELDLIDGRSLHFTAQQSASIREAVALRLASAGTTPSAQAAETRRP